ncbi:hypothetical protein D3C73_1088570 [compost metagenome]
MHPGRAAHQNERRLHARGQIGLNNPAQVLLRFDRAEMKEIALPGEIEDVLQLDLDILLGAFHYGRRQIDGLTRVRDAICGDLQDALDVPAGGLGHHADVVGFPYDLSTQVQESPLVVCRHIGKAQGDQVMEGVDVGHPAREHRQGAGPVHEVGAGPV